LCECVCVGGETTRKVFKKKSRHEYLILSKSENRFNYLFHIINKRNIDSKNNLWQMILHHVTYDDL
jgi:hypothetical protein